MGTPVNRELISSFQVLTEGLLKNLVKAADQAGIKRVALVGGIIRDHLMNITLDQSQTKFYDLDLIVEDEPEKLAKTLSNILGTSRVTIIRVNNVYQTVELKVDGIAIDIARARIERYPVLAENPEIKPTFIEDDLSRRDFTINAIAFDLRKNQFIDSLNGRKSIINRKIQFIHSKSVEEDPTRIIRAARYAARLKFDLTAESVHQIKSTLKLWPWEYSLKSNSKSIPPALSSRLQKELSILLERDDSWALASQYLQDWGALTLLDQRIQDDTHLKRRLDWGLRLGVNPLTALIANAVNPVDLAKRLGLSHSDQNFLKESSEINKHFLSLYLSKETEYWDAKRWCDDIESANWEPTSIAITICLGNPLWKPLLRWWGRWRLIKPRTTAKELIKRGWEQGPDLGKELKRLRAIELKDYKRNSNSNFLEEIN